MTLTEILWLIFEIGINLFQGYIVTWFLDRVLTKKDNAPRGSFGACALLYAGCCTTYLFFPMPDNDLWIFVVPLLYALLFFENTLLHKVFATAISALVFTGVSSSLIWIMETFFDIQVEMLIASSNARLMFVVIANLVILLLFTTIPKVIRIRLNELLPLSLFVAIVFLLVLIGDAQFAIMVYESLDRVPFWAQFSGALVLAVTVLTIILYYLMSRYAREAAAKKQLEMQIRQEKQHMEEMSHVSESLHVLRHDIRNQLSIAAELMQQGKYTEGTRFLNDIDAHVLHVFSTGCPPLDTALYLKQTEMQHKGISFHTDIEPLKTLPATAYDLCSIVSNLLDNAMEAQDRFPVVPEEYAVKLSILRRADMLYIECSNPVWEPSLKREGEGFLTSKDGENHGKGIPAIQKILDRFDAGSEFYVEEGNFQVMLAIPYLDEIDVNLPHEEAVRKSRDAIRKGKLRLRSGSKKTFRS